MRQKLKIKEGLPGTILLGIALIALITAISPTAVQGQCGGPIVGNITQNPGFEQGTTGWTFFTNGTGAFQLTANAFECGSAAELAVQTQGTNTQLYQSGLTLQPATTYRLSLAARSSTSQDVQLFVHKHGTPFTDYGLPGAVIDLKTEWQVFTVEFTTRNFTSAVSDGRLRIAVPGNNTAGEAYYFDQVILVPVTATPPTATATATTAPLTATNTATATATTAPPTATNTATATTTTAPPTATNTATATTTTAPPTATNTATATTEATQTPTATATTSSGQAPCAPPVSGNLLQNPGFEQGVSGWAFYSDGLGGFTTTTVNPHDCAQAAEVAIQARGNNVQLFQFGIPLQPATVYRLSLAARSTTGKDVELYLQRHTSPFTNYGLNGAVLDLTADWQVFEFVFTTSGFTTPVSDGRLRIWLATTNDAADVYQFDKVVLVPAGSAPPSPSSTATATPVASATSTATATATLIPAQTSTPTQTPSPTPQPTQTSTPAPTQTATPSRTPTATATPGQGQCTPPVAGNILQNPGFEQGTTGWTFYSNALAGFTTTTVNPYDCARAAEVSIQTQGSNVQLYQTGFQLQPATTYRLTMAGRSTTGRDVQLFVQRHTSPYTDFGLNDINLDLSSEWRTFQVEFTTRNFTSPVSDTRLRIWLSATNLPNEVYVFDNIVIVPVGSTPATATPQPTISPTPRPTNTPVPGATNTPTPTPRPSGGSELLVFDWNKPVTELHNGFPWDNPPMASSNGNWITPINYAEGTLHWRAEIRSMPSSKDAYLQFCAWQYNNTRETCGDLRQLAYRGSPIVVTWSQAIPAMWKLNGLPMDWANPRARYGVAIKNSAFLPVSDFIGWNWNGEDPKQWYPMNLRFTAVVVEKGKTFSGWSNYVP